MSCKHIVYFINKILSPKLMFCEYEVLMSFYASSDTDGKCNLSLSEISNYTGFAISLIILNIKSLIRKKAIQAYPDYNDIHKKIGYIILKNRPICACLNATQKEK